METVGIDFASQPASTAAVIVDWKSGSDRAAVTGVPELVTDLAIIDLLGSTPAARVGVDVPFGWPDAFVDHVSEWARSGRWSPGATPAELRYRLTDRHIVEQTKLFPLSVSSDRIAVPAFRFAGLLTLIGEGGGESFRVGGRIVEVYPAATLRRWKIPHKGYKGRGHTARALREGILAALAAEAGVDVGAQEASRIIESDHCLDALVCSLAARAAATGQTDEPPREHLETIRTEGWIELPRAGSLGRLSLTDTGIGGTT